MDESVFAWPFFDEKHQAEARTITAWCSDALPSLVDESNEDPRAVYDAVKRLVAALGHAGLLRACAPAAYGGGRDKLEVRSLCVAREGLAQASGLADFAFAMQGLGSAPISLFGSDAQKRRYLPDIVAGTR